MAPDNPASLEADVFRTIATLIEDEEEEALEQYIREAELWELTSAHYHMGTIMDAIEDEADFRLTNGQKLGAGDETDRQYAEGICQS